MRLAPNVHAGPHVYYDLMTTLLDSHAGLTYLIPAHR